MGAKVRTGLEVRVLFDTWPLCRGKHNMIIWYTASALMIHLVCLQAFRFGLYVTVPISLYVFVAYFPAGLDYFVNKV